MLSLSICHKILGAIQTVNFYNWKYLRYSRDLNLQLYLNTKNDSRFHSGNFSKGKGFYCAKVSYELLDYNTSLACYLFTFNVFVAAIIYVQNGFSVGSYSLKCSYFSWNKSFKLWEENILNYLTFRTFSETRLRDKELWDQGYTAKTDTILKKKLRRHLKLL